MQTFMEFYCGVIVGLYTCFVVGMWWYINVPESIVLIPFPLYHHFFFQYWIHLLLVE